MSAAPARSAPTPFRRATVDHPAAWTSAAVGGAEGLIHRISEPQRIALMSLAEALTDRPLASITREDAGDPEIVALMQAVRFEIMHGKGALLLSGLDRSALSEGAFERLLPLLSDAAKSHDLDVEPGRWVVEIRAHGMNKGAAVRRLTDELGAKAFVFCGDDLGDVEAFKAIEELRGQGFPALLVCSAHAGEENALAEMSDVVVAGPDGVLDLLRELTADIKHSRA